MFMHYTELKIDWLAMVGNAFFLNGIVGKPFGWGTCLLGSGDWTVVERVWCREVHC